MNLKDTEEYNVTLKNLEELRLSAHIAMQEIDRYAKLGTNTYSRIIARKQSLKLDELISIAQSIYNLKAIQILNPFLEKPTQQRLPAPIRAIVEERKGKAPRNQVKRAITDYCIHILNRKYKVGDEFTNTQIKSHFNLDLKMAFKTKSLEWSKSILADFIEDTGKTRSGKTRPEKVYRLAREIPTELINKANESVGTDWLKE